MPNNRSIAWSAALRDLKAAGTTRPDIREERLRCADSLRSTPPVVLSAWRGQSGRRYVVRIEDFTLDALEAAGGTVCIAVARADNGVARIVDLATDLTKTEAVEWLCRTVKAGASELHIHRLAETAAERAAMVADLTELPSSDDGLDADHDQEDGTGDDRAIEARDMPPARALQTVSGVVAAVLVLYARPGAWTREGIAWTVDGQAVAADSPVAVSWSLEGALERMIGDWEDPKASHVENMRRQVLLCEVLKASGVDLMAVSDAARSQNTVVRALRALT